MTDFEKAQELIKKYNLFVSPFLLYDDSGVKIPHKRLITLFWHYQIIDTTNNKVLYQNDEIDRLDSYEEALNRGIEECYLDDLKSHKKSRKEVIKLLKETNY